MMRKGFTLFVAMVVTATLTLVAMGIAALVVRQSAIATAARASQAAFYAADTAAECAIYWDVVGANDGSFRRSAFASTTASGANWAPTIACNRDNVGNNIRNQKTVTHTYSGGVTTSTISAPLTGANITFLPNPYCATFTVTKTDAGATQIDARGYSSCDLSDGRRVERAVRVSY